LRHTAPEGCIQPNIGLFRICDILFTNHSHFKAQIIPAPKKIPIWSARMRAIFLFVIWPSGGSIERSG
jgi:nitrous oxide reductase accessory protein NosL